MKLVAWPGARVTGPKTEVLGASRSFTTRTLVRVMLPALLTVPMKTSGWPGCTGVNGHCLVTTMAGLFVPGQEALAVLVTEWPKHLSLAVAVRMSGYGPQESSGMM